jgi:maleate cis-trans isomerase
MATANWRGTVGVIKPTYGSGSLVEFIRLLPEGVGVIPMYAGIEHHTQQGYLDALETYNKQVAELARIGVDLMHPEGGPPFMVRGHKAEQEIVQQWEAKYKVPIFTSGMTQTEALRALGIKKFVGCTYYRDTKLNNLFTRYFTDAGFQVLAMEGMDTSPGEADNLSTQEIYAHLKQSFLKYPQAEGIYLLGSGAWRVVDVVAAEEDLNVPVVHPVAARVWYVQKRLHVRQPIQGNGRLLAELPEIRTV